MFLYIKKECIALKVFSQSISSKFFNILANKARSFYIHDHAQISAQVNVLLTSE